MEASTGREKAFILTLFIETQKHYPKIKQTFLAVQEEKVSKLTNPWTAVSPQECCKNRPETKITTKKKIHPQRKTPPSIFYLYTHNLLKGKK